MEKVVYIDFPIANIVSYNNIMQMDKVKFVIIAMCLQTLVYRS
jgi:hypothetical protein